MSHIKLTPGFPGITAGFTYRPETARPMRELTQVLLHNLGSLSRGERELIAAYVSSLNQCHFLEASHSAAAAHHLGDPSLVKKVLADPQSAPISAKIKALLAIAGKTTQDGKLVKSKDVETAQRAGATDLEIHDTILIAATFCMFARYVDGLDTWQPDDPEVYAQIGKRLAEEGYERPAVREPIPVAEESLL
jgi:uncharacterized peroxidase-related enzyme